VSGRADFLYWTANDGIYRSTTTGSGVTQTVNGATTRGFAGVAVDPASGFVYWTETSTSDVWRSNADGSGQVRLVDQNLFGPVGIDIDPANNRMAWSTGNNILRDDLSPATAQSPQPVVPGGTNSNGVAIDPTNGHIYWSSLSTGAIRRINFDGTGLTTVVSGLAGQFDLALDLVNGFVYWTEPNADRIGRADLDPTVTTDDTTVVSGTNVATARGLALDIAGGQLYWINDNVGSTSSIFTASLSGANPQTLIASTPTEASFLAVTPAAVPEPSSMLLLAAAGVGAVAVRRFRRRDGGTGGSI
jgi:hypothetical protein